MEFIVMPVMGESANVAPLVRKIEALGRQLTVVFVDDSLDELTTDAIKRQRNVTASHVNLVHLHRKGEMRTGKLAGAVIAGIHYAKSFDAAYVAVMDGDLQHDPKYVTDLFRLLDEGADIAASTRYNGMGDASGLNGPLRHFISRATAIAAKAFFPRTLKNVSDPGTGLFAVRAEAIDLHRLRAIGFKILLEILVTHPELRVREIAFTFGKREAGISKGTIGRGMEYLGQLVHLRWSGWFRLIRHEMMPVSTIKKGSYAS